MDIKKDIKLEKFLRQQTINLSNFKFENQVQTDSAILHYNGTLSNGIEVWIEDESGNKIIPESGFHTLADGTIIELGWEGYVVSIVLPDAGDQTTETQTEETTTVELEEQVMVTDSTEETTTNYATEDQLKALTENVNTLIARIQALENKQQDVVVELQNAKTSSNRELDEEYKKVETNTKVELSSTKESVNNRFNIK